MGSTTTERTDDASTAIRRRALVRGAAWAAPTFLAATAAPAVAASSECTPVPPTASTFSFGTFGGTGSKGFPNWTVSFSPTNAFTNGTVGSAAGPLVQSATATGYEWVNFTNGALLQDDPANTAAASVTYTSDQAICLARGTYSVSTTVMALRQNARTLTLEGYFVDATSRVKLAESGTLQEVATGGSPSDLTVRTRTMSMTITERRNVRFVYVWRFPTGTGAGNDIAVRAPHVTKTA
jgi:hypothetical protein